MSKKIKAIFYAYSGNALDHLAPYAVLCSKKKIPCTFIYGEDFFTNKVFVKKNIVKIFDDHNIRTYTNEIFRFGKKGFFQFFFCNIWILINKLVQTRYLPNIVKTFFKIKGISNTILRIIDSNLVGKNLAFKLLEDKNNTLVFVDHWHKDKKVQNSFLTEMQGKAKIIGTGHGPVHFTFKNIPATQTKSDFLCEDIFLASNIWQADENNVNIKIITGNLRYSNNWSDILNEYNEKYKFDENLKKKRILVLASPEHHTGDWNRMMKLMEELVLKNNINLRILPHVRGMSSMKPPKILREAWDQKTSLVEAVENTDLVLFWRSSAIFEAVLKNKKILFLSLIAQKDINFVWLENAPKDIIINKEIELFKAIENYSINSPKNNDCFKKVIWPKGDPWNNVSNFLDKFLND
jgi:hypothetical protein